MPQQVIRFGIGSADSPYVPEWRLWSTRDDIYLAQRAMGGTLKISLHEHDWVAQFTKESGVKLHGSRRFTRWEPRNPNDQGWTVGPTLVVPWVEWAGEIPIKLDNISNITWYPAPLAEHAIYCTVLVSQTDQLPETGGIAGLQKGDMYEDSPLALDNGGRVWLCAAIRPIAPDEKTTVEAVEKEFRGFSFSGSRDGMHGAVGIDFYKDQPIVLQFPLGLRHFAFGSTS